MEFFDFIKPGELEGLPEDSQLAFIEFVKLAQSRLAARLETLTAGDADDWNLRQDAQYGFQNVIIGAARKFGIAPFASAEMPLVANHRNEDYNQFRADLSHYIAQIVLHAVDQDRSGSVPLLENVRQNIRTHIFHLRAAIDNSELPDERKVPLHKRIDDLERELDRRRVRFVVVASVVMSILAAPGDLVGSYDAVIRLTNNILRAIGQAKAADDEQRQISAEQPIALLPPRSKQPKPKELDRSEIDDEIPF